jgi:hypothetical protein
MQSNSFIQRFAEEQMFQTPQVRKHITSIKLTVLGGIYGITFRQMFKTKKFHTIPMFVIVNMQENISKTTCMLLTSLYTPVTSEGQT